jgi:hypothetical protein
MLTRKRIAAWRRDCRLRGHAELHFSSGPRDGFAVGFPGAATPSVEQRHRDGWRYDCGNADSVWFIDDHASSSSGAGSPCTVSTSGPPNRLMARRARPFRNPAGVLFALMLLRGERLDGPCAAESSNAGVLFAAERIVGEIVDRLIVNVRHAGFQPFGETRASLGVACKNRTRKAVASVIGTIGGTGSRSLSVDARLDSVDTGQEPRAKEIVSACLEAP